MGESDKSRGIYQKFIVKRTDGRDLPGEKHEKCQYFVLDITHDKHAPAALQAYADSCVKDYPQLSADLTMLCNLHHNPEPCGWQIRQLGLQVWAYFRGFEADGKLAMIVTSHYTDGVDVAGAIQYVATDMINSRYQPGADGKIIDRHAASKHCSVCGLPQLESAGGLVCSNGHGGAPSKEG
jgi:hypothetical protein